MRLIGLVDACRQAGLNTVPVRGWQTRGHPFPQTPTVVVAHHTASSRKAGAMPSLDMLINGRHDLPGPLCQVGLSRKGVVYVIASGKANHAGPGNWHHVSRSDQTVGIEAENDGLGEPWPTAQLNAYERLCAVLLTELGQDADMLCGHREWATPTGRKIDPTGIDMDVMRRNVQTLLEDDMALSEEDVDRIVARLLDTEIRKKAESGPTTVRELLAYAGVNAYEERRARRKAKK